VIQGGEGGLLANSGDSNGELVHLVVLVVGLVVVLLVVLVVVLVIY
jgi:hypothetical protein